MSQPGSRSDWQGAALCYQPVHSSFHPLVRYQTCEHDILKMNEPILMQIGTSGPRGMAIKCSTLGARRSKVKVTWGQNRSQNSLSARSQEQSDKIITEVVRHV